MVNNTCRFAFTLLKIRIVVITIDETFKNHNETPIAN